MRWFGKALRAPGHWLVRLARRRVASRMTPKDSLLALSAGALFIIPIDLLADLVVRLAQPVAKTPDALMPRH